jgi:non-specific serine/threonine protein kinase
MARAGAYLARAHIRWMRGEYTGGQTDAVMSRDLAQPLGPSQVCFGALTLLAILTTAIGDWDAAGRLHEEAFQVAWQLKDPWYVGSSLNNLGLIAMVRGDLDVARGRLAQSLEGFRQAGDRFVTGLGLDSLARVDLRLGDPVAARREFNEALNIALEFQDSVNASTILEGLALVEVTEGKLERAAQLLGAADQLRKPIGVELSPEWKADVDETVRQARGRMTKAAFDVAWKHGMALRLDEAIQLATGTTPLESARTNGHLPLTARERQVAGLIAEGLTNGEIASRLKMAERTADAHVEHIRNKLGLRTRSQIAVWAHERLG